MGEKEGSGEHLEISLRGLSRKASLTFIPDIISMFTRAGIATLTLAAVKESKEIRLANAQISHRPTYYPTSGLYLLNQRHFYGAADRTHHEYATRTLLNLATPGPSPPEESV